MDRSARVDDVACIGCGACLPECPTEAIVPRTSTPYLRLAVDDLPRHQAVVLSCHRRQRHAAGGAAVIHDRCLAAIGPEQLFELVGGSGREVWLDDNDCQTCELEPLGKAIEQAVHEANALLEGSGHRPTVRLASADQAASDSRRPSVIVEAHHGGMSRRGFFRRLIGEVTGRVLIDSKDDRLPQRRQRLLAVLDKMQPPAPTSVVVATGFGEVMVDADRCSACGLCAKFCPTSALAFTVIMDAQGHDHFDLRAHAARCVDCDVCTAACPESAITVEPAADLPAMIDRSSKSVSSGPLVSCEVCAAPVAGSPGSSRRCFSCRGGVVAPLRDEAGLMADLLGRRPTDA